MKPPIHRYGTMRQVRLGRLWISWQRKPFVIGSRLIVWAGQRRLWP